MADMSKVADLVILMIDASYGFEMETFEFLNLLQLHGFPKVVGVLTHLDAFKQSKLLQNTKKALKNRFWTEIYKGAKLFDLSGVVNGKYLKHEVKRLSLYIGRVKFRPLVWRNTHPYVVVDRVEDVSGAGSSERDEVKDVALYGYVRGTHLRDNIMLHLVGAGDFSISSLSVLDDPCPMPAGREGKDHEAGGNTTLKVKDSMLYAPMANVGRVQVDKDGGVYINIKNVHYTKPESLRPQEHEELPTYTESSSGPAALLRELQEGGRKGGVLEQLQEAEMSLFGGSKKLSGSDVKKLSEEQEENSRGSTDDSSSIESEPSDNGSGEDDSNSDSNESSSSNSKSDRDSGDDSDDDEVSLGGEASYDDDNEDESDDESTESMPPKARTGRQVGPLANATPENMMELVYGRGWVDGKVGQTLEAEEDIDGDSGDELFTIRKPADNNKYLRSNALDSSRVQPVKLAFDPAPASRQSRMAIEWGSDGEEIEEDGAKDDEGTHAFYESVRNKFVTSKEGWARIKGQSGSIESQGNDSDEEGYGDFEDLETGESFASAGSSTNSMNRESHDAIRGSGEEGESESESESESEEDRERSNLAIDEELRMMNAKKKAQAKKDFDSNYDKEKMGMGDGEAGAASKDKGEDEEESRYLETVQRLQEEVRERNKAEFGEDGENSRLKMEGFRQGLYVRIVLKEVPAEFIHNFNSSRPCVLGGLLPHEMAMGFVRARVKRHRWHKRILKSSDPLVFSVGVAPLPECSGLRNGGRQ